MSAYEVTEAIFKAIEDSKDTVITADSIAEDVMVELDIYQGDYSLIRGAADAILKLMYEPSDSPEEMLEHARQLEEWGRQRGRKLDREG